jgi:hypothetical protein
MGLSGIARAAIDRRRAPASSRQIDVAVRAEIGPPRIEPRLRQREGAGKAQADGWCVGGRSLPRYWPQRLARGSLTARPQPGECGACFRRAGFRAGGRSAWECHRGRRSGADEGRIHPVACRPVALCAGLSAGRSGAVDAWRERNRLDKLGQIAVRIELAILCGMTPMGRCGEPSDVAAAAAFLALPASSRVTGQFFQSTVTTRSGEGGSA